MKRRNTAHFSCTRTFIFMLFVQVLSTLLAPCGSAQSRSATEDEIRAAMVSRLALYVDWPKDKTDAAHQGFHVCIVGTDPIVPTLEAAFNSATVLKVPVTFSVVSLKDRLDQCHLLYVGASVHNSLSPMLPQLQQASVLVVADRAIESLGGVVIGLPLEEDHVRVQVNLMAAQASKLTISSRLLRLATLVKRQ